MDRKEIELSKVNRTNVSVSDKEEQFSRYTNRTAAVGSSEGGNKALFRNIKHECTQEIERRTKFLDRSSSLKPAFTTALNALIAKSTSLDKKNTSFINSIEQLKLQLNQLDHSQQQTNTLKNKLKHLESQQTLHQTAATACTALTGALQELRDKYLTLKITTKNFYTQLDNILTDQATPNGPPPMKILSQHRGFSLVLNQLREILAEFCKHAGLPSNWVSPNTKNKLSNIIKAVESDKSQEEQQSRINPPSQPG